MKKIIEDNKKTKKKKITTKKVRKKRTRKKPIISKSKTISRWKIYNSTQNVFLGKEIKGELKVGKLKISGTNQTFTVDKINKLREGIFTIRNSNLVLYVRKIN